LGFFQDLFGPPKPCDLCQLGQGRWPSKHSAQATWRLRGGGLDSSLLICPVCFRNISAAGLREKNPTFVMAVLVKNGQSGQPPTHAYLQHPVWRGIWMHTLETLGVTTTDEFSALAAIKRVEERLRDQLGSAPGLPSTTDDHAARTQQLGSLLASHMQRVLQSESTESLRELVSADDIPDHKRDSFDDILLLFKLFLVFVAARRRWGAAVAEQLLSAMLRPVLAACGPDAAGVRGVIEGYKGQVPPGRPVDELGALTYCACVDLFDDHATNARLVATSSMWIAGTLKMLDDLMGIVDFDPAS